MAALRGQWIFHLNAAEYETASELADGDAGDRARSATSCALLAEGHYYAGMIHMYRGELHRAREHLEQAIASHRRPARVDQVYEAQGDTGTGRERVPGQRAVVHGAGSRVTRCTAIGASSWRSVVDRPHTRASSWFMRSILHLGRAETREFAEWLEKARAYSVELNIRYWRTLASAYSNWLRAMAGDRAAGIPRAGGEHRLVPRSGARLGLVHLYVLLADLQLATGRTAPRSKRLAWPRSKWCAAASG